MTDATKIECCPAHPVTIYMAGDIAKAREVCRQFCDEVGLCVTISPTEYIYTRGQEAGFSVGLINYARFPSTPGLIEARASELAHRLRITLRQDSFTVQTPTHSHWYSWRDSERTTHD